MPPEIHWPAIALRLVLTIVAGSALGYERSKSGHAAGLRTTLLVTLAASVSMIQMNLLLQTNGKPANSYAVMDMMRLPLGILTGVGFIGAGAIVRKGDLVLGITTAATMWFATVVGLCLGGGQVILGSVAALIGYLVLWGLRFFEARIEQDQAAELRIFLAEDALSAEQLRDRLRAAHFRFKSFSSSHNLAEHRRQIVCRLRWRSEYGKEEVPPIVHQLEQLPGILHLEWRAIWSGGH